MFAALADRMSLPFLFVILSVFSEPDFVETLVQYVAHSLREAGAWQDFAGWRDVQQPIAGSATFVAQPMSNRIEKAYKRLLKNSSDQNGSTIRILKKSSRPNNNRIRILKKSSNSNDRRIRVLRRSTDPNISRIRLLRKLLI